MAFPSVTAAICVTERKVPRSISERHCNGVTDKTPLQRVGARIDKLQQPFKTGAGASVGAEVELEPGGAGAIKNMLCGVFAVNLI